MLELRDILRSHPGTVPVFMAVPVADGRAVKIRTPNPFFVSPSERLIADIEEVLGAGRVKFAGQPAG